ncbi:hypothetical protein ACHAWT_004704 [Skeletonema menzelii]
MSSASKPKRKKPDPNSAKLTPEATQVLKDWMMSPEHVDHPYPTEDDKTELMANTGLSRKQITCWFSNNRKRFWKPKMDELGKEANLMGNTLSEHTVDYLKNWMLSPEHIQNPYPTPQEKLQIMADTGIDKKQLICWFSNNRKRIWKVKVQELKNLYGLGAEENLSDEHWEMYARTSSAVAPTPFAPVAAAAPPPPVQAEYPTAHAPPPDLHDADPVPPPDLHDVDGAIVDYAAIAAAEVVESMMREHEDGNEQKRQKTEDTVESYAV